MLKIDNKHPEKPILIRLTVFNAQITDDNLNWI